MDYHVAVLIHVRQSESVVKKGGKGKKALAMDTKDS